MEKTEISWCDSTVNPSSGCDGCELWNGRDIRDCYAGNLHERRLAKSLPLLYDADFQNVRLIPGRMMKAASWSDLRGKDRPEKPWLNGLPRLIFVGDMGDFMSRDVTDDYLEQEIIAAIKSKQGSRHFWLLLTKQIARLAEFSHKIGGLPDNCMAMTTITSQHTANVRIPQLLKVQCRWRGISAEPLFEALDLDKIKIGCGYRPLYCGCSVPCDHPKVDWIVTGGLSGNNSRPIHPSWIESLRDQCARANTAFHFKQWGTYQPVTPLYKGRNDAAENGRCDLVSVSTTGYIYTQFDGQPGDMDTWLMESVGKKNAGCLLNGIEYKEFPRLEAA